MTYFSMCYTESIWRLTLTNRDSQGSLIRPGGTQDLSKYTVPTSFVGMSVPTTVVYFLPINVVRMLNVILSTKYKNVRTLQSFYEWFPQLLMTQNPRIMFLVF